MAPPLWKSTQEFLKKLQIHKYKEFAASLVEKIQKVSLPLQQLQERYKRELAQEGTCSFVPHNWPNRRPLPESEVEARRTLFEDNSSMLWNFGAGVYSCNVLLLLAVVLAINYYLLWQILLPLSLANATLRKDTSRSWKSLLRRSAAA
jgi:hypothetical protein